MDTHTTIPQIIEKILSPISNQFASPKERAAALKWELAFVRTGGLSYLLQVLISSNLDVENSSAGPQKKSLSGLIHRVADFMPPVKERLETSGGGNGQDGAEGDLALEESDEEFWQEARGESIYGDDAPYDTSWLTFGFSHWYMQV